MEQLAKNQLHTAEITGYTSEGAGVCHIAGRAVFVKGALVGETWQVRILKVTSMKPGYASSRTASATLSVFWMPFRFPRLTVSR